ncbi:nonribosomal peptide synthetase MxaA [Ancylobacter mangrovi]|uniref:nonribosomal peptide synthetase MxaA n=1 Tax=Ancylobacter mangrovi TaxID=2972472 RepID=UPI0021610FE9|nr:nonribosomal peptide synthetase MxaA [Ancylobacter mangrovi]MCS0504729.1 nonribosomal peptide synthetase MxaA [Ancylobacter mangrovi]
MLVVTVLARTGPSAAQEDVVTLYAPRSFGYVIGDTIALSADIALDPALMLDPASLPQPRAIDYWLDLDEVRLTDHGMRDGARRYTLDLVYQTFYAPLQPRRLAIPPLPFAAIGEERRMELAVPAWSFVMSPLREVSGGGGEAMVPRPDIAPHPIPTRRELSWVAAGLVLALIGAVPIARQRGWWPFHARRDRPFLRAVRTVRGALAQSPPGYAAALMALHRAFDATAGRSVFAEDLPAFFENHPRYRAAKGDIDRLFGASRRIFFAADLAGAQSELPVQQLTVLARDLRAIEREAA